MKSNYSPWFQTELSDDYDNFIPQDNKKWKSERKIWKKQSERKIWKLYSERQLWKKNPEEKSERKIWKKNLKE